MQPDWLQNLANLPWTLQLVLASGYCSYLLAYVGMRQHHTAIDTLFASLAFGLVALVVVSLPLAWTDLVAGIAAFIASLLVAVLWRKWMRPSLRKILRAWNYSWADDSTRAWDRLLEDTEYGPTQLTVELVDGRFLYCTSTYTVANWPHGPYVLGTSGDVLMYVNSSEGTDGIVRPVDGLSDPAWGELLTYIPAREIRKLSVRLLPTA